MPTDNMQIDLAGRVKNTHLSPSKVLWPLFEAITNSIHAIEDAGIDNASIHIMIERDNTQPLLKGTDFASIKNILIEDNGIGFNNDNFNSFRTSDSTFKVK
jgi:DNA topoisomerase VI subunit B